MVRRKTLGAWSWGVGGGRGQRGALGTRVAACEVQSRVGSRLVLRCWSRSPGGVPQADRGAALEPQRHLAITSPHAAMQ